MAKKFMQVGADASPFSQPGAADMSLADVDAQLYGAVDIPTSGKIVAHPIPIMELWPDLKQPRRAIPAMVRGRWNGTPAQVRDLLYVWHGVANKTQASGIELRNAITNPGEGIDAPDEGLAADFVSLIHLAGSIYKDGLIEPVTFYSEGGRKTLITGERRWLAHHLIHLATGEEKWLKIPAIEKRGYSVWEQAAENGARSQLNAIGKARQLALLIMDMWANEKGVHFEPFHKLLYPGECDRKFYAQAHAHQIRRGFSARVQEVMGLPSSSQISRYRGLLNIPDALWTEADQNSYTEFKIRQMLDELEGTNRAGINTPQTPENGPKMAVSSPTGELTRQNGAKTPDFERDGYREYQSVKTPPAAPQTPYQPYENTPYQGAADPSTFEPEWADDELDDGVFITDAWVAGLMQQARGAHREKLEAALNQLAHLTPRFCAERPDEAQTIAVNIYQTVVAVLDDQLAGLESRLKNILNGGS